MTSFEADRLTEKVEVLDGSRTRDRKRAAVRINDLGALLQMPTKLNSASVGSAPTAAQYNALVADVKMIHKALVGLQAALQERLL